MRQQLVAGNWKMHGSLPSNQALLEAVAKAAASLRASSCAVCAPFPYLGQVQSVLTGTRVAWGAQNVSHHAKGAFTGEVSAAMLKEFGCRFVIVGHSERRSLYGEDDGVVALKAQAALEAGLVPIVCVGESLAEREAGQTQRVVERQLDAVLSCVDASRLEAAVVAYEPVWAIGTGRTATPEQAQAVHRFIRERVAAQSRQAAERLPILYGGSVKGTNASGLFEMPDIDGALVGGASLDAADFAAICQAADRRTLERA
jgi:triosephosphate isomerase